MTQKVLKVGSSAAVTIPKKSLEELGLKPGDEVQVKIQNGSFIVRASPNKLKDDAKIARLTLSFINRYRKDLERLAKR
jgi:putative addiction module antidote